MAVLPTAMRARVDAARPVGRVVGIQVRPKRRAPVTPVDAWDVGGEADHGTSEKRAVTLFQAEHLPAVSAMLGREVRFDQVRRNVLVAGLNLAALHGRRVAVGAVVLEITKPCDPCERMEEALGPGGYAAMVDHGGWCARVIRTGTITVGDEVRLVVDDDATPATAAPPLG